MNCVVHLILIVIQNKKGECMKKLKSIRVDVDLLKSLKRLANEQNRTVNNLIETALIEYVAKVGGTR